MMSGRFWTAAGALALAACGGGDETEPAAEAPQRIDPTISFAGLADEDYRRSDGAAFDLEAVRAALPDGVTLSFTEARLDGENGGTVISNLELGFSSEGGVGLAADEARIWGGDEAAFIRMLRGEPAEGDADLIFSRLDARGLRVTGLDALAQFATEAYLDALSDFADDEAVSPEALSLEIETYDIAADRLIWTDLARHPVETGQWDDQSDEAKALQSVLAALAGVSFNAMALYDAQASMASRQQGVDQRLDYRIGLVGYQGYARGDLADSLVLDADMDGDMAWPDFAAFDPAADVRPNDVPLTTAPMTSTGDYYRVSDVRFAKALDYALRGEAPGPEIEDLISLGVADIRGLTLAFNEIQVLSLGSATVDLSGMSWILPSDISVKIDDLTYDLSIYQNMFEPLAAAGGPEAAETAEKVIAVLRENDALAFTFDMQGGWTSDPATGASELSFGYTTEGWNADTLGASLTLPPLASLAGLVGEDGEMDETVLEHAMQDHFAFRGASFKTEDLGGLDRMFNLVIAMGEVAPEDQPQLKGLSNYTPETLRSLASVSVNVAATSMAAEAPALQSVLAAVAAYVDEGGALSIASAPDSPITAADFEAAGEDGADILDRLKLTATHAPPPQD